MPNFGSKSERIANAEVESKRIQRTRNIEVGVDGGIGNISFFVVLVGLEGGMDGDTQVQTDNDGLDVQPQAKACS